MLCKLPSSVSIYDSNYTHRLFFSFLLHSVWCWNKMICLVKGSWTKKAHHNLLDNDRLLNCTAAVCSLLCSVSVSLIPFYKSHLFSDTQTQIWKIPYKACHFPLPNKQVQVCLCNMIKIIIKHVLCKFFWRRAFPNMFFLKDYRMIEWNHWWFLWAASRPGNPKSSSWPCTGQPRESHHVPESIVKMLC